MKKEEALDRLVTSALDCRKDFKQIITLLSALHRKIGQLEGKISVLFDDGREQRSYSQGFDLIQVSLAEGALSEIYCQLQKLGIANLTPESEDSEPKDSEHESP
ncbi:MAG: hypothetical protein RSE13_00035 [Planktothrix sp. GU0601_MAG3]|nr:MAG: hypothetical protein RSE13_00035 [Planktothrix sp. GU0601_MAG3]